MRPGRRAPLSNRIPSRPGGRLNASDELREENETLRGRIALLHAAILRINASLDLDTVLQEVVESARALTGASYGAITTVEDAGEAQNFITSGFTAEERHRLAVWPDGPQVFEHLRDLPGVLRLKDLPDYVRSLGYSPEPTLPKTMQATPMRHRGRYVGTFFLGEKVGGHAFILGDEEVLVLFASQAATAIANARVHRNEQRARADLEALVDTSPVGVVVFDAATVRAVSLNREARRIVGALQSPDQPVEQLLDTLTCRRADGRQVALNEFPLSLSLLSGETVRAEEIELSVPDGRRVAILVNATPIRSADGAVESVVVTMQDLAPLEEMDRLRSEFLGMVSHELRAPLTSIKGSAATVLNASPDLDAAEMREFFRIIDDQADHMRGLIGDLLDAGRIDTGTLSVWPEPADVGGLVEQARNTFLSGGGRHAVLIDLPPDLPRVMADRRRIVQVLHNLFSNASRHSPESLPIRVAGERDGVHVAISVSDEGRGVEPERLEQLFRKYSGLAGGDPDGGLSGTGLGLAICKGLVEAHGGRIRATSAGPGEGTRFTFTLPLAEAPGAGTAADAKPHRPSGEQDFTRVLVVDDDPQTLRFVRDALDGTTYVPLVTGDPREVPRLVRTERPGLVLLDLMLPGMDGIELMESIPELVDLPVIFISGYGRDETIARALEAGAADYIVKPFSPTELTARIRAALRRRSAPEPFLLGDLVIHYERRRVSLAGRDVPLTATEYELLRALSLDAGRVSTYNSLLRRVWGGRQYAGPDLVRTFVKKLRRKLGDTAATPVFIANERGVGYRMVEPEK